MASSEANARLLEKARRVHGEIQALARRRNRDAVLIADRLVLMKENRLASALGYESVQAYGRRELGYSAKKTGAFVAMSKSLRELPLMRAAAEAGELSWTKLRTASSIATKQDESVWLERAKKLSNRKLEREVALARGEEPLEKITLELTSAERADLEEAARAIWKEQPTLSFGSAIALACRRAVVGAATPAGGPRHRVVVTTCADCEKSSREASDGPVEIEPAALERAACDAEIVDIRKGPAALRRSMPPKIARYIDSRDRGRCRVPGCSHLGFIDRHHEGGWKAVGHDPRRAFLICSSHHDDRHDGLLRVEGDAEGELRFHRADGSCIEGEAALPASREAPARASRDATARA